jgi:hypothetical protein
MPDTTFPLNPDYIFIPAPVTLDQLKRILTGIESDAPTHPVDRSFPTNSWVTHVYSAQRAAAEGYVVMFAIPPVDDTGAHPVQVFPVEGADDEAKADNASLLIGRGNELIGYEDLAGPERVVIFRTTEAVIPAPSEAVIPAPSEAVIPAPSVPDSLSWDNQSRLGRFGAILPERKQWSSKLISLVSQNKDDLEKGQPETFIAGYNGLPSETLKIKFWCELLVAVAWFESGWDPTNVFREPFGVNSIGLLQLSRQDQDFHHLTPRIGDENDLKKPLLNLEWGVTIFARLLKRDGIVARGGGDNSRGAARYWSVLRAGHKIDLIKDLTKKNVGL